MRVLITGATGFIGYHLVKHLLSLGWEINCFVRKNSYREPEFIKRVSWIVGDLNNINSLKQACSQVDIIFHLAGKIKSSNLEEFIKTNTKGTENLIQAILQSNRNVHLIYISSLAASGPSDKFHIKKETDNADPVSSYGKSKLLAEKAILKHKNDFRCTIIRPSIVYGSKDKETLQFFKLARSHLNLHLGVAKRHLSMIYVNDLIQLIIKVANTKTKSGEIFFATDNDNGHTWNNIMKTAAKSLNTHIFPVFVPKFLIKIVFYFSNIKTKFSKKSTMLNIDKYNEVKYPYWVCSSDKAKRILNFRPRYSLEEGFIKTAKWYKKMGWIK